MYKKYISYKDEILQK